MPDSARRARRQPRPKKPRGANRMPAGSVFFDKIVPLLLVLLAVVTAALVLFAVAILLGIIPT